MERDAHTSLPRCWQVSSVTIEETESLTRYNKM